MKYSFTFLVLLIAVSGAKAQNIGIGTISPIARLHVTDSNVIFSAPYVEIAPASFSVPVSGTGARMMWLPQKAAFRVGEVLDTAWNTTKIGLGSFASGVSTTASGVSSTAMGSSTKATGAVAFATGTSSTAAGNWSTAIGYNATASGVWSTAIGYGVTASGQNSTALGDRAIADAVNSTAFGNQTNASGAIATAMGYSSVASGYVSTAMGNSTDAAGTYSTAMGTNTTARGVASMAAGENSTAFAYASLALGRFNDSVGVSNTVSWSAADPLLYLGNGLNLANRHNAMVVYKNGNTDINGYVRLGESTDGAPRIKTKKITGYNTPAAANGFVFIPHGLNRDKILSISVLVDAAGYDILPHSPNAGFVYTVNTDPNGGGSGASIAVGVLSNVQSGSVMGKAIKIFITYEE